MDLVAAIARILCTSLVSTIFVLAGNVFCTNRHSVCDLVDGRVRTVISPVMKIIAGHPEGVPHTNNGPVKTTNFKKGPAPP